MSALRALVAILLCAAAAVPGAQRSTVRADLEPVRMEASCAAEAGAAIDRGTALLLLDARAEARAAFSRAAQADPACALARWGRAMSSLPLRANALTLEGLEAERAGFERSSTSTMRTPVERGLIQAVLRLFAPPRGTPIGERVRTYETQLQALAAAHPANDVLVVLHARAALLGSTMPGDAAMTRSRAILDTRAAGTPSPGAAVVWLAAANPLESPAATRRAAERLATIALPAARRHALRAFVALGDWAATAKSGEDMGSIADLASAFSDSRAGEAPGAVAEWLAEANLQRGQRAKARALLSRLTAERSRAPADVPIAVVDETLARVGARIALDTRGADPPVAFTTGGQWPQAYAAGITAAWSAWPGGDRARLAVAERARTTLLEGAAVTAVAELELAAVLVEAAMAASQDEHQQVTLLLEHAHARETQMRNTGSLAFTLLPASELAAEIWLRFYRYPDAERAARAVLAQYPNRSRALAVLARALDAQKRAAEARTVYAQIAELRRDADDGDGLLREAGSALAASPDGPRKP